MRYLKTYLASFFDKKRYYSGVSPFSIWDKASFFAKKIYMAYGVKLVEVTIGEYTRIRQFTSINYANIGKFTSISRNVRIGMGEHPTTMISSNSIFYRRQGNEIRGDWVRETAFEEYKSIKIGNDVWIGEYATVKGGITVGDGAIIATRAVVTKDVPPYAIVGGVPAKIITFRFSQEIIDLLLEIKWWDLPEDQIEKRLEAFTIPKISKEEIIRYFKTNNVL